MMKKLSMFACLLFCCNFLNTAAASDIHKAVRSGDLEKVKSILSSDRSLINARDIIGHTPLSLSAAYARWDIFRYLLEAGANVNVITRANSTPMHCVCYHDFPDMAALLFQKGAAPSLKVKDVFGEYTPMLRAVQRGNKNVIAFLFAKGALPDETTKEGWNALHLAAKCGHRHLYGFLIENGVSLDAKDKDGKTPMEYDFRRPDPIPLDSDLYDEYLGFYSWEGAPAGIGVTIFTKNECLMLDDNCLNSLYPIGKDKFYCSQDPWKVKFFRNEAGKVDRIELTFLRRTVILNKINEQ